MGARAQLHARFWNSSASLLPRPPEASHSMARPTIAPSRCTAPCLLCTRATLTRLTQRSKVRTAVMYILHPQFAHEPHPHSAHASVKVRYHGALTCDEIQAMEAERRAFAGEPVATFKSSHVYLPGHASHAPQAVVKSYRCNRTRQLLARRWEVDRERRRLWRRRRRGWRLLRRGRGGGLPHAHSQHVQALPGVPHAHQPLPRPRLPPHRAGDGLHQLRAPLLLRVHGQLRSQPACRRRRLQVPHLLQQRGASQTLPSYVHISFVLSYPFLSSRVLRFVIPVHHHCPRSYRLACCVCVCCLSPPSRGCWTTLACCLCPTTPAAAVCSAPTAAAPS